MGRKITWVAAAAFFLAGLALIAMLVVRNQPQPADQDPCALPTAERRGGWVCPR